MRWFLGRSRSDVHMGGGTLFRTGLRQREFRVCWTMREWVDVILWRREGGSRMGPGEGGAMSVLCFVMIVCFI